MSTSTALRIDAEHIAFTDDGHAWWVIPGPERWGWMTMLDRPCDTCQGWRRIGFPDGYDDPCDDCIDGRHTFEIETEHWRAATMSDSIQSIIGKVVTHRVSVVPGMVLPMVGDGHVLDGTYLELVDGGEVVMWTPDESIDDHRSTFIGDGIMPSAAAPGMFAVKLKVQ